MKFAVRFLLIFAVLFALIFIPPHESAYAKEKVDHKGSFNCHPTVTVLLYHHLLPQSDLIKYGWEENSSVISVENFQWQMQYLHDNGYYTASLHDLEKYFNKEIMLPEKTIVITFDDGYLSNTIHAYPILKEYQMHGSIFIVGNTATDDQQAYSPEGIQHIPVDSFDQYRDVFDFACHSFDLHKKDGDKPLMISAPTALVKKDLLLNKSIINSNYFAYPYGSYNYSSILLLKELGYKMAFTTRRGYVTQETLVYEIPRFSIYQSTSQEEFCAILEDSLCPCCEAVVF